MKVRRISYHDIIAEDLELTVTEFVELAAKLIAAGIHAKVERS